MLKEIEGYNWQQAFGFSGEPETDTDTIYNSDVPERALPNDLDVSVDKFTREDVKRIIAIDEGCRDEENWLILGELHDGRFFFIDAGCDYTGWD